MKKRSLLFLFLLAGFAALHLLFRERPLNEPKIIAHRGAGDLAPENTLAGIEAALNHDAPLIEVDVQRTRDGALVLLHDDTVNRTTDGGGRIWELSAEEIAALDAGGRFGDKFAGEPVPTLEEALELVRGRPATLVIELKSPGKYDTLEEDVAAEIKRLGMQEQVMVVSFDGDSLAKIAPLLPGTPQGQNTVYPFSMDFPPEVNVFGTFWLSVVLDPTLVWRAHRRGLEVWVWTLNHPALMRLMVWLGVDGVTTDRPDRELLFVID